MLKHLTNIDIAKLADTADHEISACLQKVSLGKSRLGEVRAVEAMVRIGMRMVARKWRRSGLIPPAGLFLQTVFTHAAPKVRFDYRFAKDGFCELADLLVVIDNDRSTLLHESRRAVLIQAKLNDPPGQITLKPGKDQEQFSLLSSWPQFEFASAQYKAHVRDFKLGPADYSWSGEYGGIDQPPSCDWTQYHTLTAPFKTSPALVGAVSFGTLLAGMLAGRPGFGRPAIPLGRDPWSETVDELLNVTFNLPLRHRQPKTKRGRAYILSLLNINEVVDGRSSQIGASSVPPASDEAGGDEWAEGAISIARFYIGAPPEG